MTTLELIIMAPIFQGKNILIIGAPASGKTYITKEIAEFLPNHKVIHTDDYMHHGFEQSLYSLMDDLKTIQEPTIIEGIGGYRLLRKGVETDSYYPDVVIEMVVTEERIQEVYSNERDPAKLKGVFTAIKSCATILQKYQAMNNPRKPTWYAIENDYSPSSINQ